MNDFLAVQVDQNAEDLPDYLFGEFFWNGWASALILRHVIPFPDVFFDVGVEFAALVHIRDDVEALLVLEVLIDPHHCGVIQILENLDLVQYVYVLFVVFERAKTVLLDNFDGAEAARVPMDTESHVAIASYLANSLSNPIHTLDWFVVHDDEVADIDLELVHFVNYVPLGRRV